MTNRGSRKRIRAIRFRDNWSVEVWVFLAVMLFAALVGVPWLIRHPPIHHHHDNEWVAPGSRQ